MHKPIIATIAVLVTLACAQEARADAVILYPSDPRSLSLTCGEGTTTTPIKAGDYEVHVSLEDIEMCLGGNCSTVTPLPRVKGNHWLVHVPTDTVVACKSAGGLGKLNLTRAYPKK